VAARAEHGQVVVVAEQPVGDALHVHEVLGLGADPAEDPEDALHEQRRLDEPAVQAVREVVDLADVVALELEASARVAEVLKDDLDVLKRILEDHRARALVERYLPVVREVLAPMRVDKPEEAEVPPGAPARASRIRS
jgi:hypothetical protein